jgi:hypothetical protein
VATDIPMLTDVMPRRSAVDEGTRGEPLLISLFTWKREDNRLIYERAQEKKYCAPVQRRTSVVQAAANHLTESAVRMLSKKTNEMLFYGKTHRVLHRATETSASLEPAASS